MGVWVVLPLEQCAVNLHQHFALGLVENRQGPGVCHGLSVASIELSIQFVVRWTPRTSRGERKIRVSQQTLEHRAEKCIRFSAKSDAKTKDYSDNVSTNERLSL